MINKKLKAKGGIDLDIPIIYFPIGNMQYAVHYIDKSGAHIKGLFPASPVFDDKPDRFGKKKILTYFIDIEGEQFFFDDKPINKFLKDNPITPEIVEHWYNNKLTVTFPQLYSLMTRGVHCFYDFRNKRDCDIVVMYCLQTWFSDVLNSYFYLEVKSQTGGGKTTLLEIITLLSRMGLLANDVSFSVIPRTIEYYGCALSIDEIDKLPLTSKEEIFKILRTGQRRGQKYIRSKPRTLEPEAFDCYGPKAFSYRGDIADDLKNRSFSINTAISKNLDKPAINKYKEIILNKIQPYLFSFYMDSLDRLININKVYKILISRETLNYDKIQHILTEELHINPAIVNEVNKVNKVLVNNTNEYDTLIGSLDTDMLMQCMHIFLLTAVNLVNPSASAIENGTSSITSGFCSVSVNGFDGAISNFKQKLVNLTGRNIELFYILVELCSYLGTDIFDWFVEPLEDKQEFERYDEVDFKAVLREVLIKMYYLEPKQHETMDTKFHYYRDVQEQFNLECHKLYGVKPSANELKKQFRELGFIDKEDKKVIKYHNKPTLAILYTNRVLASVGLEEEIQKEKKEDTLEIIKSEEKIKEESQQELK